MAKKKILLKSEDKRSLAEVASFLRDLADKIERNQLVLMQGDKELNLSLPEMLTFEFELEDKFKKNKGTKRQLEIELEWYPDGPSRESVKLG